VVHTPPIDQEKLGTALVALPGKGRAEVAAFHVMVFREVFWSEALTYEHSMKQTKGQKIKANGGQRGHVVQLLIPSSLLWVGGIDVSTFLLLPAQRRHKNE
jgi:hypothetical protein